jgi:hypothetical protein
MAGWRKQSLSFKDYSFIKIYGAAPDVAPLPLARDISGIPVVYQGELNSCVACAVTWIQQYLDNSSLEWRFLAEKSGTDKDGARPKQVLEPARKIGICSRDKWPTQDFFERELDAYQYRVAGYAYLHDYSKSSIYHGLLQGPLMVGVDDYMGVGPHMMAAYDIDGDDLVCANWWTEDHQDTTRIPISKVTFACSILKEKPNSNPTMPPLQVFKSKIRAAANHVWTALKSDIAKWLGIAVVGTGAVVYGASGVVARFSTTLSGGITSTATSIPVSSLTLADGETAASANFTFPLYLTINPTGSTAEDVECWGLTSLTFTNCGRGLSWLGGATTSTSSSLQFAHSQGEKVIMSNTPYFYNRFMDISANQVIAGIKNFTSGVTVGGTGATGKIAWNGSALTWSNDGVNTYAFSASAPSTLSASTTKGIGITDSKIHINASSTMGLKFDTGGKLQADNTIIGFLGVANTWTKGNIFSSWVTSTGGFRLTTTPSNSQDATNKAYVDLAITQGAATGTAWQAITAGQALWVTATSSLRVTSSSAASSTYQFVGIALETKAAGAEVKYAPPGSTVCKLSSLVPGMAYYLNGTAGQIATTPGTYSAKIGRSLSATCFQVSIPKFIATGNLTISGTGDTTITTGFYPSHIWLRAGVSEGSQLPGVSVGDETNRSVQSNPVSGGSGFSASTAWYAYTAANHGSYGTVASRSANGFVLNCGAQSTVNTELQWIASNE